MFASPQEVLTMVSLFRIRYSLKDPTKKYNNIISKHFSKIAAERSKIELKPPKPKTQDGVVQKLRMENID